MPFFHRIWPLAISGALIAACLFASPSRAQEASLADAAQAAIAADAASTAAALSAHAVETNPLGWLTVPIRLAVVQYAKKLPPDEGRPINDAVSAAGWGAAANNVLVLAGFGPSAMVVGAAVSLAIWNRGADEREFLRLCRLHRTIAKNPQLICTFKTAT